MFEMTKVLDKIFLNLLAVPFGLILKISLEFLQWDYNWKVPWYSPLPLFLLISHTIVSLVFLDFLNLEYILKIRPSRKVFNWFQIRQFSERWKHLNKTVFNFKLLPLFLKNKIGKKLSSNQIKLNHIFSAVNIITN